MASTLLAVLAASGLAAAQTPAAPATRAAQALPVAAAAQAAPVANAGCFVPVQDGKLATIGELRKNQSIAGCTNPAGAVGAVAGGLSTAAKIGLGIAGGAGAGFAAGRSGRPTPPPISNR